MCPNRHTPPNMPFCQLRRCKREARAVFRVRNHWRHRRRHLHSPRHKRRNRSNAMCPNRHTPPNTSFRLDLRILDSRPNFLPDSRHRLLLRNHWRRRHRHLRSPRHKRRNRSNASRPNRHIPLNTSFRLDLRILDSRPNFLPDSRRRLLLRNHWRRRRRHLRSPRHKRRNRSNASRPNRHTPPNTSFRLDLRILDSRPNFRPDSRRRLSLRNHWRRRHRHLRSLWHKRRNRSNASRPNRCTFPSTRPSAIHTNSPLSSFHRRYKRQRQKQDSSL